MKAVKTSITDIVYRGPGEVGDLWCYRQELGLIVSIWEPTEAELELINDGGKVVLGIFTEPIPPVSLGIYKEEWTESVGEHPYKVIPELEDEARHNGR